MQEHILSILIFFPALAAMLGFIVHKDSVRAYGITVATIEFFLSLLLWNLYDPMTSGMQFMESAPLVAAFGINYLVGIDGISLFIIVLSTFFTMIGIASLTETRRVKDLIITLLFLEMTMVGVFAALDAVVFYVFWELSLIPMLYIIGAWG
ncbi:MAG: NADH-quinone oxidoreductase subunit M, partial [Sulfuricurvum sp. 24-42-5]